jgi:hypothetical protein
MAELLASVADLRQLEEDAERIAHRAEEELTEVLSGQAGVFEGVKKAMAKALQRFAPGFEFGLGWASTRPLSASLPGVNLSVIGADGIETDVAHQGHGIQRSLMFGVMTAQAELGIAQPSTTILTVIEEPEAFQHPLSARSLARTFSRLSDGSYQIAYSTHSPDLILPAAIDGLRIFSRVAMDDDRGLHTVVREFALVRMIDLLQSALEEEGFTEDSMGARIEANLDSSVMEGLFAKLVVVVEGDEDEALVRGAASAAEWDLDSAGVAIIRARGKLNIPLIVAFFLTAGVPVYPVFDLDRQQAEEKWRNGVWVENGVRKMLGVSAESELADSEVTEQLAYWREDLRSVVRAEIGETYDSSQQSVCEQLGYRVSQGRKVAPVVRRVLERCYEGGSRSESLDRIVEVLGTRLP